MEGYNNNCPRELPSINNSLPVSLIGLELGQLDDIIVIWEEGVVCLRCKAGVD